MKIKNLSFTLLIFLFIHFNAKLVNAEIKVKSSAVYAQIKQAAPMYTEMEGKGDILYTLDEGAIVEILMERSAKWYYIEVKNIQYEMIEDSTSDFEQTRQRGWVAREYLQIPEDTPSNKVLMTSDELEDYVNGLKLTSESEHLIFTDIDRQQTHIFLFENDIWKLLKSFICSTGKNETPTTRGLFKTSERGTWFYSKRLGSGGKYWVRFNGSYLFHSVAMDEKMNIIDGTLGERCSSGCIRLSVEDAKWLYQNITDKSTVWIE